MGIFLAKILAIKDAISYSVKERKRSTIFSDNLSAIKAIKNNDKGIYDNFINHSEFYNQILLLWIPANIGILGNEATDRAAKKALELARIPNIPFSLDYFQSI